MSGETEGRPKAIADEARLLRIAPSTNPDGLDLTVAEFAAMSVELRRRTFCVDGLGDVPLVQPGRFLDRASRGLPWYVRFEAAPEKPGAKDRKTDRYVLVVKAPQFAEPEAGGGVAVAPKVYVLEAKEPDAARLEALVFLARKSGRRIRLSSWPIERIESLSCRGLLERYRIKNLGPRPDGKEDANRSNKTLRTYDQAVRVFQRVFAELEIGDLKGDWISREYELRSGRPATSRYADFKTVQMALNGQLAAEGADYKVKLHNSDPGRVTKEAWTVEEYDRLLKAAEGWLFEPGGAPKMVEGPDGPVRARRHGAVAFRRAWRRAIEFLPYTASRHGRLPITRWVPPEVEPSDGLPLPRHDRPWIEVTDDLIYYHRDGDVSYDGNKGRAGNVIPAEFAPVVRGWYEEDMAAGLEFVFHRSDGQRYRGEKLGWETFKWIVEDAGIVGRRIPHHLKDLAKEWAEAARLRLEAFAEHADTSAERLSRTYGDALRTALLQEAAEGMTQERWRTDGERRAAIKDRFGRSGAASAKASRAATAPISNSTAVGSAPPAGRPAGPQDPQTTGRRVRTAGGRT